jgi:hypothetical protein
VARSEDNAILGKVSYPDLNLTNYPDAVDTRANNPNMKGFENLKDYNLAEHVNALSDAVMAIQRALGIQPYIDKDGVNKTTVDDRVTALENKDYDPRYGGAGWITSQTLVGHTHTGQIGHPSQINLDSEVQGTLPKARLSFAQSGGITGADLSLSTTDVRKIPEVVNDKLSVSQGGTIQKSLEIKGQLQNRLYREWDASTMEAGAVTTDYTALTNQVRRGTGTAEARFLTPTVSNLLYGKYVLAVRAKVSSRVSEDVLSLKWYDYLTSTLTLKNSLVLKGTDFTTVNEWQMFYLTFDHTGNVSNSYGSFQVWKPTTTNSINVDIDCVYIMPTHPAVYDR